MHILELISKWKFILIIKKKIKKFVWLILKFQNNQGKIN